MRRLLLPLLAIVLVAPLQADSIDATAEAYLAAIQAQDWQKMTTFLDADSHYQDFSMEHFDRPRIDLQGGEAIVEFWRTASEDAGTSEIGFDFEERFVAGPNLFLLGHSLVKAEGAAWGLPVELLDTRFPQITHLRIEEGRVTYHADHVDYGTAERQIAEQVEAWREEHGGDATFPVTAVDASLKERAEEYLATLREKRWDDAVAFLGDGSRYQNFSVEHFGRVPVDLEGAQALLDHFRATTEKQQVVDSRFEVERHFISGSNIFLVGSAYVKKRATAWEMPQDVVDARFRQIHHVRFDNGGVSYHADHVDHAAAEEEFQQVADRKKEQAEALVLMNKLSREMFEKTRELVEAGNLLGEMEVLRGLMEEYAEEGEMIQNYLGQTLATKVSFLGDHHEALRLHTLGWQQPEPREADPSLLEGFKPRKATEALAKAVAGERAVFINEAHHVAQHRVLTLRLLPILRDLGFTHFAAETLYEQDEDLAQRGYPTNQTGYYTQEPLYGELVRQALELGYEVVAYEPMHSPGGGPAQREPGQAQNLKERIFDQNPEARVLVHLGYGHNSESPRGFGGVGAMAVHFEKMTGIDPFTIDQTLMTERHDPAWESALYRYVMDSFDLEEATVFENAAGELWNAPKKYRDVTIFLPRSQMKEGRATWLNVGGTRQTVSLPKDICGAADHCLVEARPVGEGSDAIPVDRVEIRKGEAVPVLILPMGEHALRALDAEGQEVHASTVTVRE